MLPWHSFDANTATAKVGRVEKQLGEFPVFQPHASVRTSSAIGLLSRNVGLDRVRNARRGVCLPKISLTANTDSEATLRFGQSERFISRSIIQVTRGPM